MKRPSEFTLGEISGLMRVCEVTPKEIEAVSLLISFAERWSQHEGEYTRKLLADQDARRMREHKEKEEQYRKNREAKKPVYFQLED